MGRGSRREPGDERERRTPGYCLAGGILQNREREGVKEGEIESERERNTERQGEEERERGREAERNTERGLTAQRSQSRDKWGSKKPQHSTWESLGQSLYHVLHQHGANHHLFAVDSQLGGSSGPCVQGQQDEAPAGQCPPCKPEVGVEGGAQPRGEGASPSNHAQEPISVSVLLACSSTCTHQTSHKGHDPGWQWRSLSAPRCGHSDRRLAA